MCSQKSRKSTVLRPPASQCLYTTLAARGSSGDASGWATTFPGRKRLQNILLGSPCICRQLSRFEPRTRVAACCLHSQSASKTMADRPNTPVPTMAEIENPIEDAVLWSWSRRHGVIEEQAVPLAAAKLTRPTTRLANDVSYSSRRAARPRTSARPRW